MVQIPDDPMISRAMRDGVDDIEPICPVCHSVCSTIYKNACNEIVGCDECIESHDAVDVDECFPQEDDW